MCQNTIIDYRNWYCNTIKPLTVQPCVTRISVGNDFDIFTRHFKS